MTNYDPTNRDPEIAIRTDLWSTMTLSELVNQQDLLLTRMSLLQRMPQTDSIRDIKMSLQHGYDELSALIDSKTTQNQI